MLAVGIVGSGPAAFYLAQKLSHPLLTQRPTTSGIVSEFVNYIRARAQRQDIASPLLRIDMFERKVVPFGLVRDGVAPDHPDVKNCTDRFNQWVEECKVLSDKVSFRWFGNVHVTNNESSALNHTSTDDELMINFHKLIQNYDALVLANGAPKAKMLPQLMQQPINPNGYSYGMKNVWSAVEFVAWYNGDSSMQTRKIPNSVIRNVAIVGAGNVALDCARMFLALSKQDLQSTSNITTLPKPLDETDMPKAARDFLFANRPSLSSITLLIRRGPKQVAFSAKEIRELCNVFKVVVQSSGFVFSLSQGDFEWLERDLRDPELDRKTFRVLSIIREHSAVDNSNDDTRLKIHLKFGTNVESYNSDQEELKIQSTAHNSSQPCDFLITSIGQECDPILSNIATPLTDIPIYKVGWCKTGAKGVLASTVQDASIVAQEIFQDFSVDKRDDVTIKNGLEFGEALKWSDWKVIEEAELKRREKFGSKDKILEYLHSVESR